MKACPNCHGTNRLEVMAAIDCLMDPNTHEFVRDPRDLNPDDAVWGSLTEAGCQRCGWTGTYDELNDVEED